MLIFMNKKIYYDKFFNIYFQKIDIKFSIVSIFENLENMNRKHY